MSQRFWDVVETFFSLMNLSNDGFLKDFEVRTMLPIGLYGSDNELQSSSAHTTYGDFNEMIKIAHKHADKLFMDIDINKDGVISLEEFKESYNKLLHQHVEEEVLYLDIWRCVQALIKYQRYNNIIGEKVVKHAMKTLWPALVDTCQNLPVSITTEQSVLNIQEIQQHISSSPHVTTPVDFSRDILKSIQPIDQTMLTEVNSDIPDEYKTKTITLKNTHVKSALACALHSAYGLPKFASYKDTNSFLEAILSSVSKSTNNIIDSSSITMLNFFDILKSVYLWIACNTMLSSDVTLALRYLQTNDEESLKTQKAKNYIDALKSAVEKIYGISTTSSTGYGSRYDDFDLESNFSSRLGLGSTFSAMSRYGGSNSNLNSSMNPIRGFSSTAGRSGSRYDAFTSPAGDDDQSTEGSKPLRTASSRAGSSRLPQIGNDGEDI